MPYFPPNSRDELLARYAAGEKYFAGMELDSDMVPDGIIDLSEIILDDSDFSNCWFTASFRNSSLKRTKFRNANIKTCDFSGADLTDADFQDAAMEGVTWSGATLLNTKFGEVRLYGELLSEARFLDLIERERG